MIGGGNHRQGNTNITPINTTNRIINNNVKQHLSHNEDVLDWLTENYYSQIKHQNSLVIFSQLKYFLTEHSQACHYDKEGNLHLEPMVINNLDMLE